MSDFSVSTYSFPGKILAWAADYGNPNTIIAVDSFGKVSRLHLARMKPEDFFQYNSVFRSFDVTRKLFGIEHEWGSNYLCMVRCDG